MDDNYDAQFARLEALFAGLAETISAELHALREETRAGFAGVNARLDAMLSRLDDC